MARQLPIARDGSLSTGFRTEMARQKAPPLPARKEYSADGERDLERSGHSAHVQNAERLAPRRARKALVPASFSAMTYLSPHAGPASWTDEAHFTRTVGLNVGSAGRFRSFPGRIGSYQ